MANSKVCQPCNAGQHASCWVRWQDASPRVKGGSLPKRDAYTYRCPDKH